MCNGKRHSIHCILPPHILDSIITNGDAEQRAAAQATRAADTTFRFLRSKLANDIPMELRRAHAVDTGPSRQRSIMSAGNEEALSGPVVRAEGAPPVGDAAVDEAYDGLGATFDFFYQAYRRNSIDDAGLPLNAIVHYGSDYNNAFWDGRRMVFGDGDGTLFGRFTQSLDVIAHELGHGITEDETGLVYLLQPGALNEHLSDVWGSLVKQWIKGQEAAAADWLIGAELLAPGVQGDALRSMSAPGTAFDDPVLGKDIQPGHMDDYVVTWRDNGGVHINSGIPNRAFYLASVDIGGKAWEAAGRVWYEAARDVRVTENTDFAEFAEVTVDLAARLPGGGKAWAKSIGGAWKAVGVL